MIRQIIILLALVSSSYGLIGYDCGARTLNITTLSLLEVGPCVPPKGQIETKKQYAQLLQINDFVEASVIQCKIEIRRTIFRCGMFSHVSAVNKGEAEYIHEVDQRACLESFSTGVINLGNARVLAGLKANRTSTHPVTLAGRLSDDGTCSPTNYADPYGSWEDVVVQAIVKVTIQHYMARVNPDSNKIYLNSGTTCDLSEGSCLDAVGGSTFWRPLPIDRCKFDQYSVLYEGMIDKTIDHETNHVVYSMATNDVTFALTIKKKDEVCGYTVYRTEHPKLAIFETTRGESFADHTRTSIENLDIFAYVNSKFVYVERHVRTQIKYLYQDIVMHRCNLERETIKNALAIATQSPDQFAYNLMKGPGYMAVTAGEVVHVVKCIPVEVKVQHGEDCYAELQVNRDNVTHFLTPRTRILKKQGTKINCNPLLPAHYSIDESWYKILPRPVEAREPIVIQPSSRFTWNYINPATLATSGIYTSKDLDDLRDHIMFPVEKAAVLNDLALEMHGHTINNQGGSIMKLLNEQSLDKIVESTWTRLWNKFIVFGTASAGILAIFILIQTVKMISEVLINGYMLHKVYGWSIHLLGAIWNSLTQLLINNQGYQQTNNNQETKEIDIEGQTKDLEESTAENEIIEMTSKNPLNKSGPTFFQ